MNDAGKRQMRSSTRMGVFIAVSGSAVDAEKANG